MNTPRFVTSREAVKRQYERVRDVGCDVVYSWKTNPTVWRVLREETGCHVACHTTDAVRRAGVPDRTWYFPLADDGLGELRDDGVRRFVVDNVEDVRAVHGLDGVDVAVRMKLEEHTTKTGRHYVYGMAPDVVRDAVSYLARADGVDRVGVHVHRKTQNIAEWSLVDELGPVLDSLFEDVDFVNIGGGIPVAYKSVSHASIDAILDRIGEFGEWLPEHVGFYAEPGRFLAGPSTKCKVSIIDVRDDVVFVDWSIFNGCMDAALMNYRLTLEEEGSGSAYMIKGCSPDSLDVLRYEALLEDPKVGDTLTFENAGAYNYVTDFCALETPRQEVVDAFS